MWVLTNQLTICVNPLPVRPFLSLALLALAVNLDTSQLGQDVESENFRMTAPLRIIVYFVGLGERKMTLRFPIRVGTVPVESDPAEINRIQCL